MGRVRISEADIERHLDALEKIGAELGTAKADADFHADFLKTVYAAEYLRSDGPRASDREAEALASAAYRKALDDRREAIMRAEKLRHEKSWRERCIEVWQTESANNRGRI